MRLGIQRTEGSVLTTPNKREGREVVRVGNLFIHFGNIAVGGYIGFAGEECQSRQVTSTSSVLNRCVTVLSSNLVLNPVRKANNPA
jgi:hypothetical protein